MSLISRLKRIGRLAIALFRGFFTWKSTIGPSPRFDPVHTTLLTHWLCCTNRPRSAV